MARRIRPADVEYPGLRGQLIRVTEAALGKVQTEDTAVCDFSVERDRLEGRLRDLQAGADVEFNRWGDGLVGDVWPAGAKRCVLTGDELRPAN